MPKGEFQKNLMETLERQHEETSKRLKKLEDALFEEPPSEENKGKKKEGEGEGEKDWWEDEGD